MASGNPSRDGPARLCVAIDDKAVAQAIALAHAFAATSELPTEPAARLAIIVEELVANLVDHAEFPPGAQLELILARDGERVTIALDDPAAPFDPRSVTAPAIPARGGNAGLALVRAFARIDSYDRDATRNRLRLSMPTDSPNAAL